MTATFYVGDAVEVMSKLSEDSVDLILTSPPFWALRSYLPSDHADKALELGSEPTPGQFIDHLIDVVEACARVLAPHGSMCIELADTYAGSGGAGGDYAENGLREGQPKFRQGTPRWDGRPEGQIRTTTSDPVSYPARARDSGALPKSLSLIPELFRLTLVYGVNPLTGRQTDRWRLRNVVRWVRPNPPVGALGDKFRPATSELMVFCKSAKRYFDLDSVRESARMVMGRNVPGNNTKGSDDKSFRFAERVDSNPAGAPPLDWWNFPPGGYQGAHYAVFPPELCIKPIKAMCPEKVCRQCGEPSRRIVASRPDENRRRALADEIRTRRKALGLRRAEMAAWFPHYRNLQSAGAQISNWELAQDVPIAEDWPVLKERLGLSDEFDDLVLGDRRWTESTVEYVTAVGTLIPGERRTGYDRGGGTPSPATAQIKAQRQAPDRFSDCGHDDWRPGLVLDPFGGSGTTALVATGHGRDCILIDLDERNYELALQRVGPFILERAR